MTIGDARNESPVAATDGHIAEDFIPLFDSAGNSVDERGTTNGKTNTRLLLIDDDTTFAHICKRYLRKDDKYSHTVITASTGMEALSICTIDRFDCMIVDYRLPDKAGTVLISELRDMLGHTMPPTIVLTAQEGQDVAAEAVRSGASDFLAKLDVTKASLCRSVDNALEKSFLRQSLTRRVKELESTNGLLLTRNAEIQRFYHTVSHEVKTPLTAIQEFVSIVHDGLAGPVEEQQKTILNYALQSCEQISSHFNDLLELSRFEAGKMTIKLTPSSIYDVFDHCIVSARPAAVAKGITLSIVDQPDLPRVMIQSNRIIQVLSNLLGNAIKFTDEGGSVTIFSELLDEGRQLRLSVTDTGCGISQSETRKVFERLYQVTPASDRQNDHGLGLGLSISSEIIGLHGSRIEVESELGVGSTFSFVLQTCEADAENLAA